MSPSLRDAIKAEKERLDAEEAQKPKGKPNLRVVSENLKTSSYRHV